MRRSERGPYGLLRTDGHTDALREIMSELLKMEGPRKAIAGMMSGLDIRYPLGEGHPLLGRRVPDLDLIAASGPMRIYSLLQEARPVLLNLGEPGSLALAPWGERVKLCEARYSGPWKLPVLGPVPAPRAVLIRPDGYAAWVGDGSRAGLDEALTDWCGPAAG